MDILMHWLSDLGSLLVTFCWVFMLIDCLTNKKLQGGRKVGWTVFIFFTQIFGALIYFCLGNSHLIAKLARNITKPYKKPYPQQTQPARPMSTPHPYAEDYRRGYQAQNTVPPVVQNLDTEYYDPEFEQPQATYPEMRMPTQR